MSSAQWATWTAWYEAQITDEAQDLGDCIPHEEAT